MLTPAVVHDDGADATLAVRHAIMTAPFDAHSNRCIGGKPRCATLASTAWINAPSDANSTA